MKEMTIYFLDGSKKIFATITEEVNLSKLESNLDPSKSNLFIVDFKYDYIIPVKNIKYIKIERK